MQSRVAQVGVRHYVYYAAPDVTWQAGNYSLQTTAVKSSSVGSVRHQRGSRTADNSDDDAVPSILPSAVRDLGCTTPGCLEASLAGCLQRKDSRRPSKARVSLDPVPWESSGSLNAPRHRRGSGRAVQIVPPFRALVQQAPGSSTLGCISRTTLPNDRRPQAALPSVPSRAEHTPRLSVRDMGKCRDLVSLCSPPASTPHAHAISTPAQPTWTACPIPATKIEGSTQTLASDILWYLMPCRLSSEHSSIPLCSSLETINLIMHTVRSCSGTWQGRGRKRSRHQEESTTDAARAANPKDENPSRLL